MSEINILASVLQEREKAAREGLILRFRVGVLAIDLEKKTVCDAWEINHEKLIEALAKEQLNCFSISATPGGLEKILLPEAEIMLYGAKIHGVRLINKTLVFYLTKLF